MAAPAATDRAQDIKGLLATRKGEIEQAFESQRLQQENLNKQLTAVAEEMLKLQGEYRGIEELEKSVKAEGKK